MVEGPVTEVVGAILIEGGRLLLGLRAPHRRSVPNCWDVIGGHVEPDETAVEALARELAEEVGVSNPVVALLQTFDFDDVADGASRLLLFRVDAWRGSPAMLGDEHAELRWFQPDEAAALPNLAFAGYAAIFAAL
jgi:8-oxo-dGTP pyrophosphatase MutT (NUDIX family)